MLSSILAKLSPSALKNSFFSSPEESPSTGQSESLVVPKFSFVERIKEDNATQNMIIWHDPNVNSEENATYCDILGGICEYKTFEDWEKAAKEIKHSSIQCHVLTSGTNGEELVKEISSLRQVAAVYVFCMNIEKHSQWAKKFSKVNLVDDVLENVLNKMKINMQKLSRQKALLRASFPGFIFDNDDDKKLEKYLDLYIKGFTRPHNRGENEEEFLALARQVDENFSHYSLFKKSYKKYDRKLILQKYNEELYKVINSCLRIGTPEAVQPCQYVLNDLERAIREEYQLAERSYSGLVYKGVFLSSDEWQELKDSIGKNIEIYGFLFADKIEAGCDAFVKADIYFRAKIIIIVLNGLGKDKQGGFAEMKEFSCIENEDEILFNVRSRFKVLNAVIQDIDGMKCRHLFLLYGGEREKHLGLEIGFPEAFECDYCETIINMALEENSMCYLNLNGSKRLCVSCKAKGEHNKHPLLIIPTSQLAFLEKMSKEVGCLRVEGVIPDNPQMMNVPFYGYECSECQTEQFVKCYKCTVCQQPNKKWCEKCATQKQECINRMHLIVLEENPYTFLNENKEKKLAYGTREVAIKFLNDLKERADDQDLRMLANESLGDIYESLERYQEATQYYLEAINVSKSAEVGCLYSKIARIYTKLGQNQKALESQISAHGKRMFTFKEVEGKHYMVAVSLEEMGDSYCSLGEKEVGKKCYEEALKIMKVLLSPKHKKFIDIYIKLGKMVEEGELAAQYYEKAIDIRQYIFGDMDWELGIMLNELASICASLNKFKNALANYQKALKIESANISNKDQSIIIGNLHYNIGLMYYKLDNMKKAQEHHENALKQRLLLSPDTQNLDVAKSYNILGEIYRVMGDSDKALEYSTKALEMRESLLGTDHLETAGSFFNLGEIYDVLGDHKKSLEYHKKALEIRQSLLKDENHVEIAMSYGVLATVYFNLEDLERSENNNWKALEIYKKIYEGEEHHDVASVYNNIAIIYDTRKKPQLAKQYFMKAGEIWSKVFGEKHPFTKDAYKNLIAVLKDLGEDETAELYQMLIK